MSTLTLDNYRVSLLNNDIHILSDYFEFTTLFGLCSLSCGYSPDSEEYRTLHKKLFAIYELFNEVNELAKKAL